MIYDDKRNNTTEKLIIKPLLKPALKQPVLMNYGIELLILFGLNLKKQKLLLVCIYLLIKKVLSEKLKQ